MMTHWRGRPIETLTREELLEVVQHLARQAQAANTPDAIRHRALGRVAEMKAAGR